MNSRWFKQRIWGWLFVVKTIVLMPVVYFLLAWTYVLFTLPVDGSRSAGENIYGVHVMSAVGTVMINYWVLELVALLAMCGLMYWMGRFIDDLNSKTDS